MVSKVSACIADDKLQRLFDSQEIFPVVAEIIDTGSNLHIGLADMTTRLDGGFFDGIDKLGSHIIACLSQRTISLLGGFPGYLNNTIGY